jgi:hypothetical protein
MQEQSPRVSRKWLLKVGAAVAFYTGMGLAYLAHVMNAEAVILGVGGL